MLIPRILHIPIIDTTGQPFIYMLDLCTKQIHKGYWIADRQGFSLNQLIIKVKSIGINSVVIHYSNINLIFNYGHISKVIDLPLWNSKLAIFTFSKYNVIC